MTYNKYVTGLSPPAPFVRIVIRNPATGAELRDVPGQLDSAADRTVGRSRSPGNWDYPRVGAMRVAGLGGVSVLLPVHVAMLGVHDMPVQLARVVAHADESWILLGRDALNQIRILLDGPQLTLGLE